MALKSNILIDKVEKLRKIYLKIIKCSLSVLSHITLIQNASVL